MIAAAPVRSAPYRMENPGRGVVAMRTCSTQVYVGWRLLGPDSSGIAFNVHRSANGGTPLKLNSTANLTQSNTYTVRPVIGGVEQAASAGYTLPANAPTQQHLGVPLQQPAGDTNDADGHAFTCGPNDRAPIGARKPGAWAAF